jgi:hypothetical protein
VSKFPASHARAYQARFQKDFCIVHLGSKDGRGTPVDIAPHIGTHMWRDFLITTPADRERCSIVLEYNYTKNGDPAERACVVVSPSTPSVLHIDCVPQS